MEVDGKGEGFRNYYVQKIEELQLTVNEKSQNLRRLQAQRNELNAKGEIGNVLQLSPWIITFVSFSSNAS